MPTTAPTPMPTKTITIMTALLFSEVWGSDETTHTIKAVKATEQIPIAAPIATSRLVARS
jgi:hypothetical protein